MAEVPVVVGMGPGLGAALARRFSTAGLSVAIASRDMAKVTAIASNIGADVHAYRCDAKNEEDVETARMRVQCR
jgi:NADP-dependent 3-hydroxy acid dehydrogenase YdfG